MRKLVPALALLLPLSLGGSAPWFQANASAPTPPTVASHEGSPSAPRRDKQALQAYQAVIDATVRMVRDRSAQTLARKFGLNILNVTWEDTGRYLNSAVGPNISDMTIQVQHRQPNSDAYGLHLMPVIRHPNFSDKTADVPLDRFFVKVGNHEGQALEKISLRQYLKNIRRYLSEPDSWAGKQKSLLAKRDTHVLVSAQACFLPIPKAGAATFNPVLFNYQSQAGDPAVLTILATPEGTSATVIDNQRDAFAAGRTWGQRLFFNHNGERASLTGTRASDASVSGSRLGHNNPSAAAEASGLNMVMLIQVPLKQKQPLRLEEPEAGALFDIPASAPTEKARGSNVEAAVVGHGEMEGPFTEIDNLDIERDPKFPIRVTVQFYQATSNGVVSQANMKHLHNQIARVYEDADYVGSLVVDGATGRPTEYEGNKQQPDNWWEQFWKRHEANTGQSREEAMQMLRRLMGRAWMPQSTEELQRAFKQLEQRQ